MAVQSHPESVGKWASSKNLKDALAISIFKKGDQKACEKIVAFFL